MSSPASFRILSEYVSIKFDIGDNSYCLSPGEASGLVLGLQISADKASLQFKEVVACRSLIILKHDNTLHHDVKLWIKKGLFTSEQFLRMIKHKEGVSNEEWYKHVDDSSRVNVLSS